MMLKDKVAIVTGSTHGIGKATALLFAREKIKVVINCRKSKTEAGAIVEEIKKSGGQAIASVADVSTPEGVKELFSNTVKTYKRVDILVNNASKQGLTDFMDEKSTDWEEHYRNDFLSAVMCSREFLKKTKDKNPRRIVNVSSIFGLGDKSNYKFMAYSAAKAALNNFTMNLAKLAAPDTLVNAVLPGFTMTRAWDGTSELDLKSSSDETLIKRFIKPEEIAETILFLCRSDSVTGQLITVDGGLGIMNC
jgi:3-oxoacyl-[acyl-carrier protein] reductase